MATDLQHGGQAANTPRRSGAPLFWGLILIAAGILFLVQTLGVIPAPTDTLVGSAFLVLGVAVVAAYLVLHAHWWTLIAGPAMLGIGAAVFWPTTWGGAAFLGAIGLGFALVALTGAERWWAIIPAGTMLTLALVALLSDTIGASLSGALLFFGLAATFGVLAVIPVHGHTMRWPLYPAIALLFFALLTGTSGLASAIFWPLALVAAGVFLLVRASMRRTGG